MIQKAKAVDIFTDKKLLEIDPVHYRKDNQDNINKFMNYHTKNRIFQKAEVPYIINPSKAEIMAHA